MKQMLVAAVLSCSAVAAHAQAWPTAPIKMIVPFPPGGGTDILARIVAARLAETNKWTVYAENRGGAGGTIGVAEAVKAAPNGYTVLMGQKDNMAVAPWLYKNLAYDPLRDAIPVAHVAYTPVVIVTSVNSRFKTLADVVNAARSAPGTISYGSPGSGTTIHLAGEAFNNAAHIKLMHVPYKGSNPAMIDVMSGNVDLALSSVPSAMSQIKAGKVRALAVTSAARSTSLPDVPTIAESGYKGFDVSTWYGLFLPAKAPKEVVTRLNQEVNKLLETPEMKNAIHAQGAEPQVMTPEKFSALLQKDHQEMRDVVKKAGLTME
ncbi:Tripartite-type tricarboxylate transporter, receptor component TctC [Noviherbaspirillum humi]|uniref:Tripartite-type tricarboxylate transporter, receptor component TctC n=1 Tax=Noviherbaspirillum humi TaxID=1688639 RepID=A0A239LXZ5_9BURK|nr:tripartite tricarboxylate transporter substrate binding protein [Noviherbaspirillum humi]SNT35537.1 Tripartite-type tricarboxylate transporter, receptor component TctC [Noviherbaspirillum humi]